jgi:hypothetical protein
MASPDRHHHELPVAAPKVPPAELVEVKPAITAPLEKQAVWVPGYWEWDADKESFVWITGVWRFPPPQRRWLAGQWVRTSDGYVRTTGQWVPGGTDKVTYLTSPPPYKGRLPLPSSLTESEFWVPGCWLPAEGGKFVWREGHISRRSGQWVWAPAHYSWAPEGWLFVGGYWDFPLKARGQAFASLELIDPKYDASKVRVDEFAPVPADAIQESASGEFTYTVEKFPEKYTMVSVQTDTAAIPDSPIVVQRTLPEPPMAVIRGVVRRGELTPAGIEVQLIGHPAVATTDGQGRFEFTDVPYGVYHVRAAGPVQNYTRRAFNRITVAEPVVEAELELR